MWKSSFHWEGFATPREMSVHRGFLDVKVKAKSSRGLTPWKAWHKQWCEVKKLDGIECGAELRLKTGQEGTVITQVTLPRSVTICRIESRSRQYAFGIFTLEQPQKSLVFLSGYSETDAQQWIGTIRKMLSIATYLPLGNTSFSVSLIDGKHSRMAKLTGLHGVLQTNNRGVHVSDSSTGQEKIAWKWSEFHQFHLQAAQHPVDEKRICVMHTSREFVAGQGQICLYCEEAPRLLKILLNRGKNTNSLYRISRSEGDLSASNTKKNLGTPDSVRSNSSSEDSGVSNSITSQDSVEIQDKAISISCLMAKTPGGSEIDDEDVCYQREKITCIPRRESGISLASGIYEEISETSSKSKLNIYSNEHVHVYEDLEELLLKKGFLGNPPPLPPRIFNTAAEINQKFRSNTLPARDLKRLSQTFINLNDSEYMVMTPSKKNPEGLYATMCPVSEINKSEDSYMIMNGKNVLPNNN